MCSYKKFIISIFLFLSITGKIISQDYAVGFDSYFIKDHSRNVDSLAYRPVLFNIWYPAINENKKGYITRNQLLKLPENDSSQKKFSKAYYEYAVSNLKKYLFDQFEAKDSAMIKKEFDYYLNAQTQSKQKLSPIKKTFPLIIYHQGLGGTIEENLNMCEFLASKGYVVVGSTFFDDLQSMGTGNDQYSRQDVNILLNEAGSHTFIDMNHIVYIGHSYGGQAGFTIINQDGCPIDLFISLDTTFDYYDEKTIDAIWDYLIPKIKSRSHLVKIPTVHLADYRKNKKPLFEIPKRYIYSDKLLITTKNRISHDGFINLGYYEAKLLKKYYPGFEIDTACYKHVNQLILNIISNKNGLLSIEKIDTNHFNTEYLPKMEPINTMSFYDTLENKYGMDSVLNLIHIFNRYDPGTKKELGWLAEHYLGNNDLNKANKIVDLYLEKYPDYYYGLLIKGKILADQNEMEKAKSYFKRAYYATFNNWDKWEMQQYFSEKGISLKE
jgi:hypothetical protein